MPFIRSHCLKYYTDCLIEFINKIQIQIAFNRTIYLFIKTDFPINKWFSNSKIAWKNMKKKNYKIFL